jgi:hypothetical protein
MNNIKQKKEYSNDNEVIDFVTKNSLDIKPSKESFKLLLNKMEDSKPSPYVSKPSHFFLFQKSFAFAFVTILFLSGGAVYLNHKNTPSKEVAQVKTTSYTDVSDQSILNDVTDVDTQLSGLDSDNQNVY